jgi:hypothetical protein
MRLFNQALLTRQAWRLIQYPNTLCAQLLKAKYFPSGSLIDTVFTGNSSSSWHAIEYGLEMLKQGIICRVGNGAQIRAWRDPWILEIEFGNRLGYVVVVRVWPHLGSSA